jgi:hypothetical protein
MHGSIKTRMAGDLLFAGTLLNFGLEVRELAS